MEAATLSGQGCTSLIGTSEVRNDSKLPSRRRCFRIVAATLGLGLVGAISAISGWSSTPEALLHRWQGAALGADANLLIGLPDAERAKRLNSLALAEIDRLQQISSFYRPSSGLVGLNAEGRLRSPRGELVGLLELAQESSALSGGAFDVTVQPIWRSYHDNFSRHGPLLRGP